MPGPLPAVPKVVRVDFHWSQAGDPNIQIRQFFSYSGTLSITDAATWLNNIANAMATFTVNQMANDVVLTQSELTDLTSNTSPQVLNGITATGGGTGAKGEAGLAFVMRSHILRRYRGGHPRTYIPGITAARLSTPTAWDPTNLAAIVADWQTFLATCVSNTNPAAIGTITHVNVSYFQGFTNHTYPSGRVKPIPTPRATPIVDAIVNVTGNPAPGSQRRRNETP